MYKPFADNIVSQMYQRDRMNDIVLTTLKKAAQASLSPFVPIHIRIGMEQISWRTLKMIKISFLIRRLGEAPER